MIAWYFTIFFSAWHPALQVSTTIDSIDHIPGHGPAVAVGLYLDCGRFTAVMEAGCGSFGDTVVGYCIDNPVFVGWKPDSTLACSSWQTPYGYSSRAVSVAP